MQTVRSGHNTVTLNILGDQAPQRILGRQGTRAVSLGRYQSPSDQAEANCYPRTVGKEQAGCCVACVFHCWLDQSVFCSAVCRDQGSSDQLHQKHEAFGCERRGQGCFRMPRVRQINSGDCVSSWHVRAPCCHACPSSTRVSGPFG